MGDIFKIKVDGAIKFIENTLFFLYENRCWLCSGTGDHFCIFRKFDFLQYT